MSTSAIREVHGNVVPMRTPMANSDSTPQRNRLIGVLPGSFEQSGTTPKCPSAKLLSHLNRLRFSMGHLIDMPKLAAGQGIQALVPRSDRSHPFGTDPLFAA